jgi:hypothetical protein
MADVAAEEEEVAGVGQGSATSCHVLGPLERHVQG